jgi:hypothetical protein
MKRCNVLMPLLASAVLISSVAMGARTTQVLVVHKHKKEEASTFDTLQPTPWERCKLFLKDNRAWLTALAIGAVAGVYQMSGASSTPVPSAAPAQLATPAVPTPSHVPPAVADRPSSTAPTTQPPKIDPKNNSGGGALISSGQQDTSGALLQVPAVQVAVPPARAAMPADELRLSPGQKNNVHAVEVHQADGVRIAPLGLEILLGETNGNRAPSVNELLSARVVAPEEQEQQQPHVAAFVAAAAAPSLGAPVMAGAILSEDQMLADAVGAGVPRAFARAVKGRAPLGVGRQAKREAARAIKAFTRGKKAAQDAAAQPAVLARGDSVVAADVAIAAAHIPPPSGNTYREPRPVSALAHSPQAGRSDTAVVNKLADDGIERAAQAAAGT